MSEPQARLFTALWPDPAARRALAVWQAQWQWPPQARPTPPEQLHLTLHFLGALPAARIEALGDALAQRAAPAVAPFELQLDRAEVWPRGLAVLCPAAPPPALAALHAAQAATLLRLGLQPETRPYRPHLTLARQAAGAVPPAAPPALRWPVQDTVLVASVDGYRVLGRYRLG